ncbi:MAG: NACHT domain-containing protein, partial [Nanoarchaeota archaeon]|nr:NACHT domain-containing protein [Nanoarchaeota archaeon]
METLLWGPKKDSQQLKDFIVRVLSEVYPLTAKQLYKRIVQTYRSNLSYQAVHKIANELVDLGILIKIGSEYMINLGWLNNISDFALSVKNFYLNKTKVNLPEEAPKSFLDVLEKYKQAVIKEFSQYKDLPFLEVSPVVLADFNTRETLSIKRNILNILRDNRTNSFLLLGDSGSGKSTLMKMIAYEYASRGKLIPIYLKLNHYAGESLVRIVKEHIQQVTGEEVREDMIKILLSEGTFLFLFDGLNEASGQVKIDYTLLDRSDLVLDSLNKFIFKDGYKNNLFVIGCRTYNDPKRRLPITTFQLNKLDDKKIKLILKTENASELGRRIWKDKELFSLCQNPLMLSMLIKSDKFSFKNKSQLYDYFIQNLLGEEKCFNDIINVLSQLAYQLNFVCFNLPYSEACHLIEKISLEFGISKEKTDEIIESIFQSNIIKKEGNYCEFMHQSIREYLAAKELRNRNFGKEELLKIVKNKQWHASLLFYASTEKDIDKLSSTLYEQFILTNDHSLLFLAAHCLIENRKCKGELFNKIINSLLNIYNYRDEKFYIYWYELNKIFGKWKDAKVNNKIVSYFNNLDSEISARMTNILFHSKRNIGYSKNKKLFMKIIDDDSNPHLQYSLIELIGIN